MSSNASYRTHLTAGDMKMIMRIHAIVCLKNRFAPTSIAATQLASLIVREFQYGLTDEEMLRSAFTSGNAFRLSIPIDKIDQLFGNTLHGWDIENYDITN